METSGQAGEFKLQGRICTAGQALGGERKAKSSQPKYFKIGLIYTYIGFFYALDFLLIFLVVYTQALESIWPWFIHMSALSLHFYNCRFIWALSIQDFLGRVLLSLMTSPVESQHIHPCDLFPSSLLRVATSSVPL